MKIAPTLAPPAALNSVAMPVNATAPNFEDILDATADLETERQERALGFSELGMLVPHAIHGADSGEYADDSPPPIANPNAPPVLTAGEAKAETETQPDIAPRHAEVRLAAFEGVGQPRSTVPQAYSGSLITVVPLTPRIEANSALPAGKQGLGRPSFKSPLPSGRPDAEQLSLVVTGENGAIQVLAGAPELSPEARERLRKAANDLAALFGVSLTEFTFNGSALEPSFASRIGGRHGYFSG